MRRYRKSSSFPHRCRSPLHVALFVGASGLSATHMLIGLILFEAVAGPPPDLPRLTVPAPNSRQK